MNDPTWGDTVRIKAEAAAEMRPGSLAAVCGLREVETQEQAQQFSCAVGTTLYLIEFGDGESVEIPGLWLEVVREESVSS